jgi:ComF family protein
MSAPQQNWQGTLPVCAWGVYGGALKRAIAALKYDNQPQLAQPLGQWLGQTWNTLSLAPRQRLTVVPIPLHAAKQRQRGYNQADLLAVAFSQVTGIRVRSGLTRSRATAAQFGLSLAARADNLIDAFQLSQSFLRHPPAGSVLLLDDIYTTGATVNAAAAVLQQHQVAVCGVVAVAKPIKGAGGSPRDITG